MGLVSFKTNVSETAGKLRDDVRCKGHSHLSDNVRCEMHQTQVKRTSRLRLKRKLKSV